MDQNSSSLRGMAQAPASSHRTRAPSRGVRHALSRRELLGTALAAGSLVCGGSVGLPVTRPDSRCFDACSAARGLTLLSWNVFMMPQWLHESPRNLERAA